MNIPGSKIDETQEIADIQDKEDQHDPPDEQIPVPPTEDVPSPIQEPVDDDKPTNPIIDEEKNRSKLIV